MIRTHGQTTGGKVSKTYRAWLNMIQRCTNEKRWDWKHYGGRGITVAPKWINSFATFHADMGESPVGLTLDRIDTNRGYEPDNCRWATWSVQQKNRRLATHCKEGHELTPENTAKHGPQGQWRLCRICLNARSRIKNQAKHHRRIAQGLCTRCQNPATNGLCTVHRAYMQYQWRKSAQKRRANAIPRL